MSAAGTVEHMATSKADALKILNSARTNARFYLHVRLDAQLPATPDKYLPGAFSAGVQVSRGAAERFISDAFSERLAERGAALKISVNTGERRTKYCDKARDVVAFGAPRVFVWIG